jgi:DNA-binding MarR family transcriptional regulator
LSCGFTFAGHLHNSIYSNQIKMRIEDEIKQKSFADEYVKSHVNVLFTASWLTSGAAKVLKPFGISVHQFNILRILRGMHPKPGSIKELTERMIDKSSNASRLVDKLIAKKLVIKAKSHADNRRAEVLISDEGLMVLADASERMDAFNGSLSKNLLEAEACKLNEFLDKLRG